MAVTSLEVVSSGKTTLPSFETGFSWLEDGARSGRGVAGCSLGFAGFSEGTGDCCWVCSLLGCVWLCSAQAKEDKLTAEIIVREIKDVKKNLRIYDIIFDLFALINK